MSRVPSRLTIASRGSRLALRQAEIVSRLVKGAHPGIEISITAVTTAGDRDRRPFSEVTGRGLFVKEVERAVVEEAADVAVHSAKDLTAELAEGCAVVCVPARGPVADVVVGGRGSTGAERLGSVPAGGRIGTSSTRRRALLAEARPDLEAVEFRGNLDTRLDKVARGEVDAAIVAAAGVKRLESDVGYGALDPEWWIPAPGQGALAVEALSSRVDLVKLFVELSDPDSWAEVLCERAYSSTLEGGCSVPLGCLARAARGDLVASAFLGEPDGDRSLRDKISGPVDDAAALGEELARAMLAAGGDELIAELEHAEVAEPSPP